MANRIEMSAADHDALIERMNPLQAEVAALASEPHRAGFAVAILDELRALGLPHASFQSAFDRVYDGLTGKVGLEGARAMQREVGSLAALFDAADALDDGDVHSRYGAALAHAISNVHLHLVVALGENGTALVTRSTIGHLTDALHWALVCRFGVVVADGDAVRSMLTSEAMDRLSLLLDSAREGVARAAYESMHSAVSGFIERTGHPGGDNPARQGEKAERRAVTRSLLRLAAEQAVDAPRVAAALRAAIAQDGRYDQALLGAGFYAQHGSHRRESLLPDDVSPNRRRAVDDALSALYQLACAFATPMYEGETEIVERIAQGADRAIEALSNRTPEQPMSALDHAALRMRIAECFDGKR